ncbi:MAG: hypothetical protein K6B65_05805 [Bacilli bacterium]|nr:hypothetical protein [Bacilli bacterium]
MGFRRIYWHLDEGLLVVGGLAIPIDCHRDDVEERVIERICIAAKSDPEERRIAAGIFAIGRITSTSVMIG